MNTSDSLPHSRRGLITIGVLLTLAIVIAFIIFRNHKKAGIDPGFSRYIESYTTGIISRGSPIRIRLAGDVQTLHEQNGALDDGFLIFRPPLKARLTGWTKEP